MYMFGPGSLFGTNTAANSTPRRFGGLQDCSVEFSFTVKELYGSNQFPLAIARGQGKVQCKAKNATLNGAMVNDLFFGNTMATTLFNSMSIDEAGTIPSNTPYTVTVSNSATFTQDLGVTYALTGLALVKVAPGIPTAGQYCVTAGVYTFAAADEGLGVKISYVYTTSVAGPKQFTLSSQLIGTTPLFQANFQSTFMGKVATWQFNNCTSAKLNLAGKLDDYTIPEFDFSCFADAAGNIGVLTFSE
jgi:hypothetical protein